MGSPRKNEVEKANDPKNKYEGSPNGFNLDDRSCTDVLCCLIWFVFTGVMVAISVYAFIMGDPQAILTKFDSDGNRCGLTNQIMSAPNSIYKTPRDFSDYPFKFFTNLDEIMSGSVSYDQVTAVATAANTAVADASVAL